MKTKPQKMIRVRCPDGMRMPIPTSPTLPLVSPTMRKFFDDEPIEAFADNPVIQKWLANGTLLRADEPKKKGKGVS